MVCDLLWLASFTQQKVFKVYSCCSMYQNSTPRYGQLILHCICTSHVFIHSSVGHLSCLCIMAIVNNFAMKHFVYIFWVDGFILLGGIWILLGVRGLVDHIVSNSRFNFWSTAKLFFTITVPYTFPPAMCWGFQFPCILLSTCYCLCFFYYSHAGGCEVVCHYGFDLHFLNN